MIGTATGGFERFFQRMGTPTDRIDPDSRPFVPPFERMEQAEQEYTMTFLPEVTWPDA
ncbi:MAG TPA: hypothetical protein VIZ43_03165 [Trebonia sp.]